MSCDKLLVAAALTTASLLGFAGGITATTTIIAAYAQDPNPDRRPVPKPIQPPGESLSTQCPDGFTYNRDTRMCEAEPTERVLTREIGTLNEDTEMCETNPVRGNKA